jgi:DNA-binding NtrC family response regulator
MQVLNGHSILIFEPDLDAALALQDTLANDGARVLTAYGADRALRHAESTVLSAAIVGKTLCAADRKSIYQQLRSRKIPVLQHDEADGWKTDAAGTLGNIGARIANAISGEFDHMPSRKFYSNC